MLLSDENIADLWENRDLLRMLGRRRDVDIAEELGVPASDVSKLRRYLKIPRFLKRRLIEVMLGKGRRSAMPDTEVARRLGVHPQWVRQVRKQRGQVKCDLSRYREREALRKYVEAVKETGED